MQTQQQEAKSLNEEQIQNGVLNHHTTYLAVELLELHVHGSRQDADAAAVDRFTFGLGFVCP